MYISRPIFREFFGQVPKLSDFRILFRKKNRTTHDFIDQKPRTVTNFGQHFLAVRIISQYLLDLCLNFSFEHFEQVPIVDFQIRHFLSYYGKFSYRNNKVAIFEKSTVLHTRSFIRDLKASEKTSRKMRKFMVLVWKNSSKIRFITGSGCHRKSKFWQFWQTRALITEE